MTAPQSIDRRTLVKALAASATAGLLAGCSGTSTTPEAEESGDGGESTPEPTPADTATPEPTASNGGSTESGSSGAESFGGWMDDVGNYDGVVDRTGQSEVTVKVGVDGNGGAYGFGPAAVSVDAGTTVVWEWTGEGQQHNVAADDGSFESELTGEEGHTFERTFEESGAVKYACVPHQTLGMKGVVVVE